MIGLGETHEDIVQSLSDLRSVGCGYLTIGQYLRPSRSNIPVEKYYTPEEFEALRRQAVAQGFRGVESGPLVRSSYMAHRMYARTGGGS